MKTEQSIRWGWVGRIVFYNHPVLPLAIWGSLAAWLIVSGVQGPGLDVLSLAAHAMAALLGWTLFEYLLHRFVLHPPAPDGRWACFSRAIHGKHHDDPDNLSATFVLPLGALLILLPLVCIFWFLMKPDMLPVFTGFFLAGYLAYEYVHLALHHWRMPTRWARALQRRHLAHHHGDDRTWFGVTSPFWDWIFRTRGIR
jgi:uncharacterized membrane protein HdeD (DUF308 family)